MAHKEGVSCCIITVQAIIVSVLPSDRTMCRGAEAVTARFTIDTCTTRIVDKSKLLYENALLTWNSERTGSYFVEVTK